MRRDATFCQIILTTCYCYYYETGGPQEARLLRKKFVEGEYLVTSRPVANDNDTVTVTFGLSLLQIRDVVHQSTVVSLAIMLSPVRLSPVTFVRPTQPVEIFGHVSAPFGTLAIH